MQTFRVTSELSTQVRIGLLTMSRNCVFPGDVTEEVVNVGSGWRIENAYQNDMDCLVLV